MADVIAAAKKEPEKITVTAFGNGGDDHLAILSLEAETGVKFAIVHMRGTADAKSQVLGGHIQVLGANVSEAAEEVRAGKLRVLGVMAPERSRFMPDVPTFKEQGFNQVWSVSRGVAAPARLPKDVQEKLIGALQKILSSKEHQKRADGLSLEISLIAADEYRKFLKANELSTKKLMNW
jgi:tripartite-type tricarboxylate transporter receptor subunit TctC